MELPDIVLPVLGFIVFIKPFFLKTSLKWHDYAEIFAGLAIMGFSIYSSWSTSQTNFAMKKGIDDLLSQRKKDSSNNADFQKFIRDTFGIEKVGNGARIKKYLHTIYQFKFYQSRFISY